MKTTQTMHPHYIVLKRPVGSRCWTHEGPAWRKLNTAKAWAKHMRKRFQDSDVAIASFDLPDAPRKEGSRPRTIVEVER